MSSDSTLAGTLRRIKPEKFGKPLARRPRAQLHFFQGSERMPPALLLDTTVYIDQLQATLPTEVELALQSTLLWHSAVTEAELSASCGLLQPTDRRTAAVVEEVAASIAQRRENRVLTPDRTIWREAGVLSGLLAKLQGYGKSEQRKTLNDALIFLTAVKHGCTVLTRNLSDFDLLQQLDSRGKVLFYERV